MKAWLLDSSGTAAVDPNYHYRKITADTPTGIKMQLINKASGVSVQSIYYSGAPFTHWAPLASFNKLEENGS